MYFFTDKVHVYFKDRAIVDKLPAKEVGIERGNSHYIIIDHTKWHVTVADNVLFIAPEKAITKEKFLIPLHEIKYISSKKEFE
jgi:hypothetical protein